MMELQRITTQFDVEEDRLCLSGEGPQGQTLLLWLTQRLLNRLLPHLTNWLEQQGGPQSQRSYADLLQGFEQQAAVAALAPQPPVQAQGSSHTWLVRSVDVASGDHAVRLDFKDQETGPPVASIALSTQALRQWLGIVHQQYLAGEWATGVWPEWVLEGSVAATPGAQVAWH